MWLSSRITRLLIHLLTHSFTHLYIDLQYRTQHSIIARSTREGRRVCKSTQVSKGRMLHSSTDCSGLLLEPLLDRGFEEYVLLLFL